MTGLREVKADACAVGLGLAVGMIVDLNDDVGLGGQADSDALGQAMGFEAGGPEAQFVGFKPGAILCGVAGPRGILVEHGAAARVSM